MPSTSLEIVKFAESLVALGEATGQLERIEADLPAVQEFLAANLGVRSLLSDGRVLPEGRTRAIEDLLGGHVHPAVLRFLQIVVEQSRMEDWPAISAEFLRQIAELRESESGEVIAGAPLTAEQLSRIEIEIARILNRKVRLRVRVDSSMLGGVIVRVGSFVVDGSADARLEFLRKELRAAG
jgi:F-type H+-transporting ATPase subunit delta